MATLLVCVLPSPSLIPESLQDLFPSIEKRLKAAEMVENILQLVYDCPESAESYYRVTFTTKQLTSKKPHVGAIARSPHWPDHITQCFEQSGKTKEEILAAGMLLVEVEVVGKACNILYLVPRDKNMLFHDAKAPKAFCLENICPANVDERLFYKYLQKGRCHACLNSPAAGSKLQACSRCKKGCYCNRDCQAADWPEHKTVCKVLKETSS